MALDEKSRLREVAASARKELADKDSLSQQVMAHVLALEEVRQARAMLWYVNVRDEVRTQAALASQLANKDEAGPSPVVPYCCGETLRLVRLESMDELCEGRFGILEPHAELRDDRSRHVSIGAIDVALIPGVAFDRNGGRIGHGRGFYDRLLAQPQIMTRVGIAFECQVLPKVPMAEHDIRMDLIVTERGVCRGGYSDGLRADDDSC